MSTRLTIAEYRALAGKKKAQGRNKYGARKTAVEGISFDSKKEAKRYTELRTLERAGEIEDLKVQIRYSLMCGGRPLLIKSRGYPNGRKATYVADFVYIVARTGETIIEDTKGFRTPVYRLKRAIMEANGYRIVEV